MNRFDGFHEFVAARGGALSRTAFLLTGEHHAAEDLVQSALAKAAARWRQIMEYGQPEAYVRRTMINEHISWWRRRPARPMAELPDRPGADEPHQVVDRVVLGQALATLTPRQRAVVVLRYYEDLSEADTAAAMGCSVGTVKSQTHLAIGKLRSALPMFAEQARVYADAEAAVTRARHTRARRAAAGAALSVLLLGLAAVLFGLRGGGDTVPPPLTPTPSPSRSWAPIPPAPTRLTAPAATPADLPRDRGVGPASLLRYGITAARVELDVLAGAEWYRLTTPNGLYFPPAEVSPDGRWLLWYVSEGALLRDLTGTSERLLPGVQEMRWSPSGDWMFLWRPPSGYTVESTEPGTVLTVPQHPGGWGVAGVLDTGELVRVAGPGTGDRRLGEVGAEQLEVPVLGRGSGGGNVIRAGDGGTVTVELLDPRTGTVRRLAVGISGWLRPGEQVGRTSAVFAPMHVTVDGTVAVEVSQEDLGWRIGAYLEFSPVDGTVSARLEPAERVGRASEFRPLCFRGAELLWRDGAAVKVRSRPGATVAAVDLHGARYRLPGCWESL
ncbi:hypothetical protein CS0771_02570 [Catellatospora sp. IY07-71]|nr:hypothetical protein CS0771_02570 [Catellatospora sp. IY07-71]